MTSLGGLLIVFGLGSLVLPMLDMQFILMSWLDPYQPIAGIAVAAIGAVLVFMGMSRQRAQAPQASPPTETPPPA
jgi:hypothetical protein